MFVGRSFPEYKMKVLEVMNKLEYDEEDQVVGGWQGPLQTAMKGMDKKLSGLAMSFAKFVLDGMK